MSGKGSISKFLAPLLLYLLLNSGCDLGSRFSLRLYPPETEEVSITKSEPVDPEVAEVRKALGKRPSDRIKDEVKIKTETIEEKERKIEEKRHVKREFEDIRDAEWEGGWEYINKLNINTFATNEEGDDKEGLNGLLVREDKLKTFEGDKKGVTPKSIPKFSFVHLSDVQLHDEWVYMFSKELTDFFDKFVQSFKHKPGMVLYDYSYYMTLVGTIKIMCDRLPEEQRLKPSFMIHTGDAIDMGVVSELYEFIYITNRLNIPWFNVLGNHDYPVYGNINAEEVGVVRPDMGFQTVSSRYNFINMHGKGFDIDSLVYFSPSNAPHHATTGKMRSVYNGFDMKGSPSLLRDGKDRRNLPCSDCPGYYYFEAKRPQGQEPGVLCIVLDTTIEKLQAKGTVSDQQLDWLRKTLAKYSDGEGKDQWMVLVFGHHPLRKEDFFDKSYETLLELFREPKNNVIAYFCGHTHKHEVKNQDGFWEIITDSVFEYPKRGSLVTIYYTEEGKWEMTLQSFWPYFLKEKKEEPELLKNAKKCFKASKEDDEGKKLVERFKELDQRHYDVVLRFAFPKTR